MMAIALGVLLLTAAVTAGLARRSEVTNARHDVERRAEVVGPEFDSLIEQLPSARRVGRHRRRSAPAASSP